MKKSVLTAPLWWLGVFLGLVMPILGVFLMLESRPELLGIQNFEGAVVKQINVQIITLGLIINAGLFFLFLKLNKELLSQGLLLMTVLYLVAIFFYRFLL